jgi:CDP-diacylglycerol---serine O-phosphatidyltransferase
MHSMPTAAGAATLAGVSEKRGWSRALYLIPSSLTLASVLCGWYAIVCSVKGALGLADHVHAADLFGKASLAIGLAIILDNLDGRIARTIGATSEFGVELDSLADVLTFGAAAAMLAYACGYGSVPGFETRAFVVSFVFIAAGAIRLARSNVLSHNEHHFVGLPIPAAAGVIAGISHFYYSPMARGAAGSDFRSYSLTLMAAVIALSLLMVSTFPYSKLKFATHSRKHVSAFNRLTFPLVALVAGLGFWFNSRWVVLTTAVLYAVHGPIVWAVNATRRNAS